MINTRCHLNYCYFVEHFAFINVRYDIMECPEYRDISLYLSEYPAIHGEISRRINTCARKFAFRVTQRSEREVLPRGSTWEMYFLIMLVYLQDK